MTSPDDKDPSIKPRKSRATRTRTTDPATVDPVPEQPGTELYAALAEVGQRSQDLMLIVDVNGTVKYANPKTLETFGVSYEEGLGTSAFDYLHPGDVDRVVTELAALLDTPRGSMRDTVRAVSADGDVREIEIVSTNALDSPAVAGVIINGRDVTDVNRYLRELEELEQRFRLAFEDNMAPMIFTGLDDRIIAANDAFCSMIGFERQEVLGGDSKLFTYPEDVGITEESYRKVSHGEMRQSRYTKRYVRKDGRLIFVEVLRSPARDEEGNILYYVISERDITDERSLATQLSHQALHDTLTGLANRALFNDRLDQARAKMLREGGYCAVLLLDLDDFKAVNDTLGHLAGDELLVAITRRLNGSTRSSDTLCRFGGDEFLYLAEGLSAPSDAELAARRLLDAIVEPFFVAGTRIDQQASIGVVVLDGSHLEANECIQDADVALYQAKREGKSRFVIFTPSMREQAVNRFALVQELGSALVSGDLEMHYQPIFNLNTVEIVGFESLMRWQHPRRGPVPPSVFIPAAEQSELTLELGQFALRQAIAAAATWVSPSRGGDPPYVTVNLSPRQFHDPGLVPLIAGELKERGLAGNALMIEVTEGVTLLNVNETLNVVAQLAGLGVTFALDDFGTGFTSLSYLALLQPKIIKVDQSLVSPTVVRANHDVLLKTIIALGHMLNVTVLAEGVETAAQLDRLRGLGCELGQGFLWSPAVPNGAVLEMLASSPTH